MGTKATPGTGARWPETPWTLIRRAREGGAADRCTATDRLFELYYTPVQRYFARALRVSDGAAEDVTQSFFAKLLERQFLDGLKHETSLRGFLKLACRRHRADWCASESAYRRALRNLAVTVAPEGEPALDPFDEELRRFYVEEARRRIEAELLRRRKAEVLAIFDARTRFDGSRPDDYATLAARFGLRVYDIQNRLEAARRIFRRELLRIARERADDPEEELRELGLDGFVEE